MKTFKNYLKETTYEVTGASNPINLANFLNDHEELEIHISDCPDITSLDGLPDKQPKFLKIVDCFNLKSLKGCYDRIGSGVFLLDNLPSLSSFKDGPTNVFTLDAHHLSLKNLKYLPTIEYAVYFNDCDIDSLISVEDYVKFTNSAPAELGLGHCDVIEGGLGIMLIDTLRLFRCYSADRLVTKFDKACALIQKWYEKQGAESIYDCQQELLDNGLEAYAQI